MRLIGRTRREGMKILKTVKKEYALMAKNGYVWFRAQIRDNLL